MALATVGTVLQTARELIGDVDIVSTGEQFTDAKLLPKFQIAFRELNDLAVRYGLPDCERRIYRYLEARRSFVSLHSSELEFSFDEPHTVHEARMYGRHKIDSIALVSGSNDGRISGLLDITLDANVTSTTFRMGTTAVVHDVTGSNALNGEWPVNAVVLASPILIRVNSPLESIGSPTYTNAYVAHPVNDWELCDSTPAIDTLNPVSGFQFASHRKYVWGVDYLEAPASYLDRMFRITAFVNFTNPSQTSDTIYFEAAEQFLAARTAALAVMDEAAGPDNAPNPLYVELDVLARGRNRESDGSGGFLADWLSKQRIRRRRPPVGAPVDRR